MSGPLLSYATLPRNIKVIAKDSLGLGVLKSLFSYGNTYHLMIKISDGIFIGFSLYHFEVSKDEQGREFRTGVIDCVCVAAPYRGAGFGTLLTFGTIRKMAALGADRVELLLKTPRMDDRDGEPGVPTIGSESLLQDMGFRQVKVYDDYFLNISRKYGYDCAFCGNKPDTCKAVLYAISRQD